MSRASPIDPVLLMSCDVAAVQYIFQALPTARRIEKAGARCTLGSRALDILIALTERPGEVISHKELTRRVWRNLTVSTGCLRVHVTGLRKALGDAVWPIHRQRSGARLLLCGPGYASCSCSMPFSVPTRLDPLPGYTRAQKLTPMLNGLEAWRATMKSRVDEALATLAYEGAEIESWFRVKIHGHDYFLWYVRAEPMQKV